PLSKEEKKIAVDQLKSSRDNLFQSVKGLSETQLTFKSSAEEWSIQECVQHLALAENLFRESLNNTMEKSPNPEKRVDIKLKDEEVLTKMASREKKVKTYPSLTPDKSTWPTTKDALNEIKHKRKTLIQFVKTTETDLRNHVTESPMGMVDAYQLILMNAAHTNRHIQQIMEVKNHPEFPKN